MITSWAELGRRVCVVAACLAPGAALADEPRALGEWTAILTDDAVEAKLEAEIEDLSAQLAAPWRTIARQLLRRVVQPCRHIAIWEDGGALAIQCDAQAPAISVPDGRRVAYTGRDGRTHELILHETHDGLVQRFETPRGSRTSRYVREGDLLRVHVAIESPRLPQPLEYTVTYQ